MTRGLTVAWLRRRATERRCRRRPRSSREVLIARLMNALRALLRTSVASSRAVLTSVALLSAVCGLSCRHESPPTVLPQPELEQSGSGAPFVVGPRTQIVVPVEDPATSAIATTLQSFITRTSGAIPPIVRTPVTDIPHVVLRLDDEVHLGPEGYELSVNSEEVRVTAEAAAGLFHGIETLRQLLPYWSEYRASPFGERRTVEIPPLFIKDQPRYAWRGAMLDVARHFLTVAEVERFIDILALLKLNRLHLHLTDDQGWRIAIRAWPDLTRVGAARAVGGSLGGFYSQDEYRQLVLYGAERYVTVIPEIDMPGHVNAALASYGQLTCNGIARPVYLGLGASKETLCVTSATTYRFIRDVISEVADLTDGPYFHAGGDEALSVSAEQYSAFMSRVERIVAAEGKQMIAWGETAREAVPTSVIVQLWQGAPRPSLGPSHALILSPHNHAYLDAKYDARTAIGHTARSGVISTEQAYEWIPSNLMRPAGEVLGVEAPLWSETVASMHDVEFLALPRLAAIAEIGWAPASAHDWGAFRNRLGEQARRWTALGLNYYRAPEIPWCENDECSR